MTKTENLKIRLIKTGYKQARCEQCDRTEYCSKPIPLELNHKNGNKYDNRLENVEILCSNCHSQTSTFSGRNRRRIIADDQIIAAVNSAHHITEAILILGFARSQPRIRKLIREAVDRLNLNISHWKYESEKYFHGKQAINRIELDRFLVIGSKIKSFELKARLIRDGLKDSKCEFCGITDWCNNPIVFALDHINGIPNDNRFSNLRILCFICHARTPTYKGKNIGKNKKIVASTA